MFDGMSERNVFSWTSIMGLYCGLACTNLSLLQHGKQIHAYCIKTEGLNSDVLVGNALVDFYAKCTTVDVARRKFNLIKEKDLISWNSMLAGYAMGGCHEEAILLLNEMKALGFVPDIITWNGLITGFTKTGDGNKGLHFFFSQCVCTCRLCFSEGLEMGSGYLNPELAEQDANIYSAVGRWEDAAKLGDASHPLIEEISAKVESLYSEIKEIGYVPETNFVLQDVEDDEKENSLCGHSE
ncbi:hypothetical protein Syun_030955 [Stephania yunnanensis]|uniref:Pentatricopeptide repeat-containing protein n=1 Tax=Stephania yunnanensis TaxID=152371 RepID=A0AAP0HBB6_9MAGN